MREHIKILGILNIIMGSFAALAGVVVLVVMGGVASVTALGVHNGTGGDENAWIAAPIIGIIGLVVAIFLLILALPSIIGGWRLLKYKSWSRVLMLVISALHLLSVPLGTALGVYGLWVLLNEQTRQLLESGGTMPPPATFPMQQPASFPGTQPPQSF
jgi:hypothetical protein